MHLRCFLFPLIALVALSPPALCAQSKSSGTIPSTGGGASCVTINVDSLATVAIQVTGSWTGTLQPEISVQGQAPANIQVTPSTSTTPASTITANGVYRTSVAGGSTFLLCGNTVASGTANIFLNASTASAGLGSGAGSGTVTNTGGALTLNSPVLGAGGSDTKVSTGITSNGASEVDLGLNGTASGVLGLNGSTSGKATLTAPATAGTVTNPIAVSNSLQTPNTANVGYCVNGGVTECMNGDAAGNVNFVQGSNVIFGLAGSHPVVRSNQALTWATTTASITAVDTGLSRTAAALVAVGNGTAANESGLLRSANTCAITADVALTVNVANSFCSFSLPAVAKAWAFRCDIQWAITAGSGTNTFALGVNPSQTPTGTTNGEAQVYTATTGTQTMGSTAISASGATVILTGATYTPAATVQLAKLSGTVLASATAGTFAIQATANGTTATAAVKAGSTCQLF